MKLWKSLFWNAICQPQDALIVLGFSNNNSTVKGFLTSQSSLNTTGCIPQFWLHHAQVIVSKSNLNANIWGILSYSEQTHLSCSWNNLSHERSSVWVEQIMSAIVTVVLKGTLGFLVKKGRQSAAEKLKDGDVKEARNSFFGLWVYLLKSKFRIEDKLRFPWYYTTFSTNDQSLFSCWFPSNSCHHSNGNGQPLILNNVEYLQN